MATKRRRHRWPFQLTHLLRGATQHAPMANGTLLISTHAPLARCDMLCRRQNLEHCISTHAPLARCDECKTSTSLPVSISTHAPLARCDAAASGNFFPPPRFQLTHLLRGATEMKNVVLEIQNFNSRTSCEVRQLIIFAAPRTFSISTHAPLARCDQISNTYTQGAEISTHAPLARCDPGQCGTGGRGNGFQLTHLLRGATMASKLGDWIFPISTHAPLARCDTNQQHINAGRGNFNSRTSCEVRHLRSGIPFARILFQLTHLLRGAT